MFSEISSSTRQVSPKIRVENDLASSFSLKDARLAQVSPPMLPSVSGAAAKLAAEAVKAVITNAPSLAVGVAAVVSLGSSSLAESIFAQLSGAMPRNVSTREQQMASVAMADLNISAEHLSHLTSQQKVFFVKAAAALADRREQVPTKDYLGALRMLLDKTGQISSADRITPEMADRLFGLRPEEAPPRPPGRTSFPGPERRDYDNNVLVSPRSEGPIAPNHTGSGERPGGFSPPFMESGVEKPILPSGRRADLPRELHFGPTKVQSLAEHFVGGHGSKHQSEYAGTAFDTTATLRALVRFILTNIDEWKKTDDNRFMIYDKNTNTLLIVNSGGRAITMFRPAEGRAYFDKQPGTGPQNADEPRGPEKPRLRNPR